MSRDELQLDMEQLHRMVRDGTLTEEESARLQKSLDEISRRERPLASSRLLPDRQRRNFLLALCTIFVALAVMTGILFQAPPDSTGKPPSHRVEETTASSASGRPIDLSTLSEQRRTTMAKNTFVSGAVFFLIVAAIIAGLVMALHNRLVDSREAVHAGWAQVENVYQRRLDLVPLLIDAVQTYMEHERDTLQALTDARANALQVDKMLGGEPPQNVDQMRTLEAAQGELQSAMARLFAVVESYPDLKASQNFLALQDQIEGTENRIAMERRHYNEYVRAHNAKVQKFPGNIVAGMMDFTGKPYFQAEDSAMRGLQDPFGRNDRE